MTPTINIINSETTLVVYNSMVLYQKKDFARMVAAKPSFVRQRPGSKDLVLHDTAHKINVMHLI